MGVTLARIVRPQGRRGEVAAEVLTDFPDRLTALREAYLWDGTNPPQRVGVRACRLDALHPGRAIFHFEGCQGIADAERLRGLDVQIPLAERAPLPTGRYYVSDLVGCAVFEQGAEHQLGCVRDVQFLGEQTTGAPLLVVEAQRGELLIPLAEEICTRIDIASHRIEVALPDGLRELNLPGRAEASERRTEIAHRLRTGRE